MEEKKVKKTKGKNSTKGSNNFYNQNLLFF